MHRLHRSFASLTLTAFLAGMFMPHLQPAMAAKADVFAAAVPGELLVRYEGTTEPVLLSFSDQATAEQALKDLSQDEAIDHVQPNYRYEAAAIPSDPLSDSQTYLDLIDAYKAWDIQTAAKDVVIAVIDSGVYLDHEDLRQNIWVNSRERQNGVDDDGNGFIDDINGWDFLENGADPNPKFDIGTSENAIGVQHGTGVAGIIAATGDNAQGIAGLAWDAQIMSLRVLNQQGAGDSETVTKALKYAIDQNVDIINLSLVGTSYDTFVVELLDKAYQEGIIVVAAAGNNGVNLNVSKTYPACYNGHGAATVIAVGALTDAFVRPSFSNYGSDCVDITAPGVKIFTTRNVQPGFKSTSKYEALFSGTSFAAPQVTGVIALMKAMKPSLDADEVLFLLQQGSTRLDETTVGASGFSYALNAAGTLALLAESDTIDPDQPIEEKPPVALPNPQFLAFPRGPYGPVAYQYEMPGPILLSPVVFDDDGLSQGMRIVKEAMNSFLLTAWRKGSRKLWRYNALSKDFGEVFAIPAENEQTIGNVVLGNVDFDPKPEFIVAAGPDSKPLVSVYNQEGALKFQFQAYPDAINGGLDVAVADINSDGIMEIVTVPVSQTSAQVRVFEYTGLMITEFNAYAPNFRGGGSISVADTDDDGQKEIIVGPGAGGGPHVKVFALNGTLKTEFFAGEVSESSGAIVDFYQFDNDLEGEYVVSYHQGHQSIIRIYNADGTFREELGVFDPKFAGAIGIVSF